MNKGLHITKELLISASGLDSRIVDADIKAGKLRIKTDGKIWFHDALNYVDAKWKAGKAEMYPQVVDKPEGTFAARVLSRMDDQIVAGNLEVKWN